MLLLGRWKSLAKSSQEARDGYVEKQVHRDQTHSRSLRALFKIKHRKPRNKSTERPTVIGSVPL